MALYESVILLRQDMSSSQVETTISELSALIQENKGKALKAEYWGLRTLAYRMNKSRKAHYVMMAIDCPHEALTEMQRVMRINEDIMRSLDIRVEVHADEASMMMRDENGAKMLDLNAKKITEATSETLEKVVAVETN